MKKIVNTLDVSKIDNFSKIFDNIALLVNIEPKRKKVLQEEEENQQLKKNGKKLGKM